MFSDEFNKLAANLAAIFALLFTGRADKKNDMPKS
jgi:hypothetical protein